MPPQSRRDSTQIAGFMSALFCFPVPLKHKLQRKLQNSRIQSGIDLAECAGTETCSRGCERAGPHAVQHVECFASELNVAAFQNVERSRNCHIELPCARTENRIVSYVAVGSDIRESERGGIDPVLQGLVPVGVQEDLIGSLDTCIDSAKGAVHSG